MGEFLSASAAIRTQQQEQGQQAWPGEASAGLPLLQPQPVDPWAPLEPPAGVGTAAGNRRAPPSEGGGPMPGDEGEDAYWWTTLGPLPLVTTQPQQGWSGPTSSGRGPLPLSPPLAAADGPPEPGRTQSPRSDSSAPPPSGSSSGGIMSGERQAPPFASPSASSVSGVSGNGGTLSPSASSSISRDGGPAPCMLLGLAADEGAASDGVDSREEAPAVAPMHSGDLGGGSGLVTPAGSPLLAAHPPGDGSRGSGGDYGPHLWLGGSGGSGSSSDGAGAW